MLADSPSLDVKTLGFIYFMLSCGSLGIDNAPQIVITNISRRRQRITHPCSANSIISPSESSETGHPIPETLQSCCTERSTHTCVRVPADPAQAPPLAIYQADFRGFPKIFNRCSADLRMIFHRFSTDPRFHRSSLDFHGFP